MASDDLALEARNLRDNTIVQAAFASLRDEAISGLVNTPASEADTIRDHQAMMKLLANIEQRVAIAISSGTPRPPGLA
jgi:hypothetical protein